MRPLEAAARKLGVRDPAASTAWWRCTASARAPGRVLGIAVEAHGERFDIRARKAVIIATGGSTGNVNFRRMFDPRLTEEYCGLAGMPWSDQDASGEIAGMAIGASLWGLYNQTGEFGYSVTKPARDRLPVRLPESAVDAGQCGVRQGSRHRTARAGLAGRRSW